jgi:Xaa-Pro aminopeptidase
MDRHAALTPDDMLRARRMDLAACVREHGANAAMIYGDTASADELQYLAGVGPYWNNAVCIVDQDGGRYIVSGMTARVNFWVAMMSGADRNEIRSAGPSLSKAAAEYLKTAYSGGVIGVVGRYFPEETLKAIEAEGFTTVSLDEAMRERLTKRDEGSNATRRKGVELMKRAVAEAACAGPDRRTMQEAVADVEYACRRAGAMDTVILAGDRDLCFFKAPDRAPDGPWTLFALLQYLGEWLVVARNSDPALNAEAFAVRDALLKKILPGTTAVSAGRQGWEADICPQVRSDHASWDGGDHGALWAGQTASLRILCRGRGILIEDMILIEADGAEVLTDI